MKFIRVLKAGKETLKIKFVGIDDWGRPIFKPLNKNYYLSDTGHLFRSGDDEKTIKEFYAEMPFPLNKYITYHGSSFDSEPYGNEVEEDLEIV